MVSLERPNPTPNGEYTPFEAWEVPVTFTMPNIANAVACAVEEIHNQPMKDPSQADEHTAMYYGKQYVYQKILEAKENAVQKGEKPWETGYKKVGYRRHFSHEQTRSILRSLQELIEDAATNPRRKISELLTSEVIERSQEIIFSSGRENGEVICDLETKLIPTVPMRERWRPHVQPK